MPLLGVNLPNPSALVLIKSRVSCLFATLIHELDINLAVRLVLHVDYMHVAVVASCQHHRRVGRNLQVKLVEDVLAFVHFAELLFQVIGHVHDFAWLSLVADVPDLYTEVVTWVNVPVVDWRELGAGDRVYDVREKVFPGRILLDHEFRRALVELGVDAQVAQADVPFGGREQEYVAAPWMVLDVGDDLGQLFNVRWL